MDTAKLLLPEIVALGGALVLMLWDLALPRERKGRLWFGAVAVALLTLAATFLPEIRDCVETPKSLFVSAQFRVDALAVYMKRAFAVTAAIVFFMSREYVESLDHAKGEFWLLGLFTLVGTLLCASVNDFMSLFVALETVTVSFYVLAAFRRDRASSVEAGLKLLVIGSLSAGFLLYGIAFVYGATGSVFFDVIQGTLAAASPVAVSNGLLLGVILIFLGLGFKTSAVPLHVWVPDVYQGAPTPVTAYLSVASKLAGFVLMLRVLQLFSASPALVPHVSGLLAVVAALTLLFGNLGALPQTNIKRLLGYSSIAQCGYVLVGLAASWKLGIDGALFYMAAYVVMNLAAFAVVLAVSRATGSHEIDDYSGLARRSPLLGTALTVALLSLAGVPPLWGFVGKFMLLGSAFRFPELFWLGVIGLATVVIALYYYLRIVKRIWVDEERVRTPIGVPVRMRVLLAGSTIVLVAIAVVPQVLQTASHHTARQMGFVSDFVGGDRARK